MPVTDEMLYDYLPRSRNKDCIVSADRMINSMEFMIPPFGTILFSKSGIDWDREESRSFLRLLHGHTFLGCLTDAYILTNEKKYLNYSCSFINDWLDKYKNSKTERKSMAYHDETTALRLQYWLKLYMVGKSEIDDVNRRVIIEEMKSTAQLLFNDDFHSTNTNHGMFQDISLILYSIYFDKNDSLSQSYIKKAVQRLENYISFVYTSDGVHKEHSPGYHFLISNNLSKIVSLIKLLKLEVNTNFEKIFNKTEKYSTHIIKPNGELPNIGDTVSVKVENTAYKTLYLGKEFQYACTNGEKGKIPRETDVVFKDAGYAIFRDDWGKKKEGTYLLFTAAYHTDYHKHSDDLNLLLYSNGQIISEAGPYSYNYNDPYSKYAYSSHAHNTLIVDGVGLPRTDNLCDKVFIKDYEIKGGICKVSGVNQRYEDILHIRSVEYNKNNQTIFVKDEVSSSKRHEYKLLWHFAKDISVRVRDRIIEIYRDTTKVAELEVVCNSKVRCVTSDGKNEPYIQGWHFPKMEHKESNITLELVIYGSSIECTSVFRLKDFVIPEKASLISVDNLYESTENVRYHFIPAEDERLKPYLLVVFSSLRDKYHYYYNYIKTLDDIKANKLFILDDFGDQGSYYMGYNKSFEIESTVNSLIQYHMSKLRISHNKVITIGTSKGGFAALYFGMKYYFGNIIAGGPQTMLGDFLLKQTNHSNIAEYIAGGANEGDRLYLNSLMFNLLSQPSDASPDISLLVGKEDHHYENHVLPLYKLLVNKGFNVKLDLGDNMNHDQLGERFPSYLNGKILEILQSDDIELNVIREVTIKMLNNNTAVVMCDALGNGLEYAYYISQNEIIEKKVFYQKNAYYNFEIEHGNKYMVRVFVRDKSNNILKKNSDILIC